MTINAAARRNVEARTPVTGTFTKLRDGSWGARVTGSCNPGDVVVLTRKNGSRVPKTISRVLWTGQGVSLCTFEDSAPAQAKPEPVAPPPADDDDAGSMTALDFL